MKKYKNKIIILTAALAVLLLTFWWGGNSPNLHGVNTENKAKTALSEKTEKYNASKDEDEDYSPENGTEKEESDLNSGGNDEINEADNTENNDVNFDSNDAQEEYDTREPISNSAVKIAEERPNALTAEQEVQIAENEEEQKNICTISVRCDSILDNLEYLNKSKRRLIPPDGVILNPTEAKFNDGENVFNVLQRELKRAKIHLEFTNTPIFDSVYIEGINNIYEFDCGENSGWMYSVNGEFPNFGCSNYVLKGGDIIEWVYTCDLGKDVGGYYANTK